MASTYTSKFRLELQTTGENEDLWGDKLNNNFSLVEDAIAGYRSIDIAGTGNYTLSAGNAVDDEARNFILDLTGTLTGNRTLIAPDAEKTYIINNGTSGSFTVGIKTSSGSTTIDIPQGEMRMVYCDGSEFSLFGSTIYNDVSQNTTNIATNTSSISSIDSRVTTLENNPDVPSGTRVLFPQTSVPTGYTQYTAWNDRVMRVVNSTGAGTGGSWNNATGLTIGNTVLTQAQIPSHYHYIFKSASSGSVISGHLYGTTGGAYGNDNSYSIAGSDLAPDTGRTSSIGSSQGHNHSISSASSWRPQYVDVIVGTKS